MANNLQQVVENGALVNEVLHRTTMATLINLLANGRSNAIGSFTLAASAASTMVTDNLYESTMVPMYFPTTANASAEIGAGTIYVSARADGTFTLTHANNGQTDRDFIYVRMG